MRRSEPPSASNPTLRPDFQRSGDSRQFLLPVVNIGLDLSNELFQLLHALCCTRLFRLGEFAVLLCEQATVSPEKLSFGWNSEHKEKTDGPEEEYEKRNRLERRDVLQLSKISKRATGWVDPARSHAATSNSLLMN